MKACLLSDFHAKFGQVSVLFGQMVSRKLSSEAASWQKFRGRMGISPVFWVPHPNKEFQTFLYLWQSKIMEAVFRLQGQRVSQHYLIA